MDSTFAKIILTMKKVTELLVCKKYSELEQLSSQIRLTASEIKQAISDYDGELIMPPDSDFHENLDIIEITGSKPKAWSVRYDLWTKEEMRSDLSLEVTLIENGKEFLHIEIDNIHVL